MGDWQFPAASGHMERPTGVYVQTMNMAEINARLKQNDLIIIPVGSTECHGAAQPLGEDTFLVSRMAEHRSLLRSVSQWDGIVRRVRKLDYHIAATQRIAAVWLELTHHQ